MLQRVRLWGAAVLLLIGAVNAAAAQDTTEHPEDLEVPAEVPKVEVPVPGERKWSLIPVPEIIVSPTEGITGGVLGVLLFANEDKSISGILAPDVRYNKITGAWPAIRYFGYPDPDQQYYIVAGKATKHGDFFDADYVGENRLDGLLDV